MDCVFDKLSHFDRDSNGTLGSRSEAGVPARRPVGRNSHWIRGDGRRLIRQSHYGRVRVLRAKVSPVVIIVQPTPAESLALGDGCSALDCDNICKLSAAELRQAPVLQTIDEDEDEVLTNRAFGAKAQRTMRSPRAEACSTKEPMPC